MFNFCQSAKVFCSIGSHSYPGKVNVKTLICPRSIGPVLNYDAVLRQLMPDLSERDRFNLKNERIPSLKSVVYYSVPAKEKAEGFIHWSELEQMGDSASRAALDTVKQDPSAIGNIQFTSGTTGRPKAAALTHYNLVNNAKSLVEHLNKFRYCYHDDMVTCNVLPLYHIFSFVAGSLCGAMHTSTNVYPAPGFSAEASIAAIEKRQCNYLIGTPTMFTDILHHPSRATADLSSLDLAVAGGAPVTPQTVISAEEELNCTVRVRQT